MAPGWTRPVPSVLWQGFETGYNALGLVERRSPNRSHQDSCGVRIEDQRRVEENTGCNQ